LGWGRNSGGGGMDLVCPAPAPISFTVHRTAAAGGRRCQRRRGHQVAVPVDALRGCNVMLSGE